MYVVVFAALDWVAVTATSPSFPNTSTTLPARVSGSVCTPTLEKSIDIALLLLGDGHGIWREFKTSLDYRQTVNKDVHYRRECISCA